MEAGTRYSFKKLYYLLPIKTASDFFLQPKPKLVLNNGLHLLGEGIGKSDPFVSLFPLKRRIHQLSFLLGALRPVDAFLGEPVE